MVAVLSGRVVRLVVSVLAGCGVGVSLYGLREIDSSYAFAIGGALVGLVAALGMDVYRRTARLTEVRITVPQLSELTFVVNNDAQRQGLIKFR